MPDKHTVERAREDLRRGKSPSTAAGEFVKKEIEHLRRGQHGAKSTKQAIAIGLSQARRAGIPVRRRGQRAGAPTRPSERPSARAKSPTRARATLKALKKMPRRAASKAALSRQGHAAALGRSKASRSQAARKAARTRARARR